MKSKNTKYRKTYNLKATIFSIIVLIIMVFLLIYNLLNADNVLKILGCLFFLILIVFGLIGVAVGILKGKSQIIKERQYVKKTNPYIYFRELPNNFGIGVTSLLFNSTIENYKDIVAVILDLCARKYLNLAKQNDKYVVRILKNIDDELLSNEKYILTLIMNNDIKNINYQKWYNYCMQDGINLGLYNHNEIHLSDEPLLDENKVKNRRKIHLLMSIISGILTLILFTFDGNLMEGIGYGVICFILTYVILIFPFHLVNIFTGFKNMAKLTKDINYKNIIENTLTKTKKGIEELQKIYSFKAFINDFGNFASKKADEIVLWDRYLSYAQVFGLTKEIMSSGYRELVENSSFHIDNVEDINLYNIEIEK